MLSTLRVVTPPAQALGPLPVVRRHLRVDNSLDDDLIQFYLDSATAWVQDVLGRALLTQTLEWTMADAPPLSGGAVVPGFLPILPMAFSWGMLWQRQLEFPRSPVQSVSSIAVTDLNGVVRTLESADFVPSLGAGTGRLRLNSPATPGSSVAVRFVAGYGDDAQSVPAPIRNAALLLMTDLYENRGDAGGEMPPAVMRLLWPYRVTFFGG